MKRAMLPAVAVCCLSGAVCLAALKQRHTGKSDGRFDYYILSLSWAPNYCAGHPKDHSIECRAGRQANFVLHGLWPEANRGSMPTNCSPASPVASSTARHMLQYYPSRGLIQHEWSTHGTCSGLSAGDYFSKVEQAFNAVRVPDQYRNLDHSQSFSVQDVEQNFASANGAPAGAFRISCRSGELVNVQVCMNKDLQYQACAASARECSSPQVLMRPVH
jgi:ribonuclease T2